MHISPVVALTFGAFASIADAVQIRNHYNAGCSGGYIGYSGIAQRVCAPALRENGYRGSPSSRFIQLPNRAIARGWQRTRDGQICGSLARSGNAGTNKNYCLSISSAIGEFAGTSWNAPSSKRDGEAEPCLSTAKPDTVVLNDGHLFNTEAIPDADLEILISYAINGTTVEYLPENFIEFEEDVEGVEERVQEIA
ncbi:hypothetical protein B0J11DRAFT_610315 [Dendryphion nanum]|uniref:Uncharacterized protein n=1 Tax=Dendryphion nanum TaxID=256645 RepID=A0A9P9EJ77_9PLEO|nr:hypothetical protein B0J11DRAFT_610315 [Dendryphion nanum]